MNLKFIIFTFLTLILSVFFFFKLVVLTIKRGYYRIFKKVNIKEDIIGYLKSED